MQQTRRGSSLRHLGATIGYQARPEVAGRLDVSGADRLSALSENILYRMKIMIVLIVSLQSCN
jgi:hypothetical protein